MNQPDLLINEIETTPQQVNGASWNPAQYCSVKENRRLGFAEPQPNKAPQMLGFVPQPNLRWLRFLGLTEQYWNPAHFGEVPCKTDGDQLTDKFASLSTCGR